ncbi:MAG: UDP-N-acetylmuramate--alanine ligase [Pseudomonadota bacterium]
MTQVLLLGIMLSCATLPFILLTWLVRRGQSGYALTAASVIGATLVILLFAAGRPIGIDPVFAMTLALLGFVPAMLGALAGALLGWILRRQDDQRLD